MPDIPEKYVPLMVGALTLLGTALIVGGAVIGHVLSSRAQKRAAEIQSIAARDASTATAQDKLIDQLQEELGPYRTQMDARMTELEKRNGLLVDRNDAYRDLLHKHRAHIWDQLPPPPPEWPEDLPR